jgi:hypothetical protein
VKIPTYQNGRPTGEEKEIPGDLIQKAHELAMFMLDTGALSIYGIGPVADLQRQLAKAIKERDDYGLMVDQSQAMNEEVLTSAEHLQCQLAEVTRERDTLKAMVDLHDVMNDRRRAQANQTPFKRRTYENG